MEERFYIGKGRYESLTATRYKDQTYGRDTTLAENLNGDHADDKHGTYGAMLFDKRWKQKREEILKRDGHACVICKNEDDLQVHHRQYHFIKALQKFKAPWDYENHLMITLCEKCHSKGHSKYRIPNVYL